MSERDTIFKLIYFSYKSCYNILNGSVWLFDFSCLNADCFCLPCFFLSCVEEDRYDSYSRMILKYFLSEGVVCRHELFVATAQDNPDDILQVRGDKVLLGIS